MYYLPKLLNANFESIFSDIKTVQLMPLEIQDSGYLSTVALLFFPTSEIQSLSNMVKNTSSSLYSTQYETITQSLSALIDPGIPVTGLTDTKTNNAGSSSSSSSNSNGRSSNSNQDTEHSSSFGNINSGSLDYIPSSKSASSDGTQSKTKKRIIPIIVGTIAGGMAVIIMLFLFFRYHAMKRREQLNQERLARLNFERASSCSDDSIERYNNEKQQYSDDVSSLSPSMKINKWMNDNHNVEHSTTTTDVNGSKKIIKISMPIATQNSLGWNDI